MTEKKQKQNKSFSYFLVKQSINGHVKKSRKRQLE